MSKKTDPLPLQDMDCGADWETLDSRASAAVHEIQSALEEALAATRDLGQWVERLHTLSSFIQQLESGLLEIRHRLTEPTESRRPFLVPPPAPKLDAATSGEPWPFEPASAEPGVGDEPLLTASEMAQTETKVEAAEPEALVEAEQPPEKPEVQAEDAELEDSEPAVAEAKGVVHLEIESSEANIDLMVVERALRETPGVADVDLLDYAGKRARVQVKLSEGDLPEGANNSESLAASVRERLAKLTWDGSLSVSAAD